MAGGGFSFTNPTQYAYVGQSSGQTGITPEIARKLALAQQLQAAGASTAPIYGGIGEGLARLAQALIGGYSAGQAGQEAEGNRQSIAETLAKAAQAGKGWTNPDTGQLAPGTGGRSAQAAVLAQNPLTASMGSEISLAQQQAEEEARQQAQRDERLFGQRKELQGAEDASALRLAQANQAAARQLESMRENAPTDFQREIQALGIDPKSPQATALFLARHGVRNPMGIAGAPQQQQPGWAGGTPTNELYTGSDADKALARADATAGAKLQTEAGAAADKATTALPQIRNLEQAAGRVYTGPYASMNNFGNRLLSAVSPEASQKVQAFETLQSGSSEMARGERQPGEGVISDFDAKQFLQIVPGPSRSRAFNERALAMRTEAQKAAIDKQSFLNEYRRRNGNMVGADTSWNAYIQANPLFAPNSDMDKPETWINPKRKSWREFFADQSTGAGGQQQAVPDFYYDPATGSFKARQ